jgi:hypothetical protein
MNGEMDLQCGERLQKYNLKPQESECFLWIPTYMTKIQAGLTEKCATYLKIILVSVAFFVLAAAAPVAVWLTLGSISAVVIGTAIGGGVVALVALIAVCYFQVHAVRSNRWLAIVKLITQGNTTREQAIKLLELSCAMAERSCQFYVNDTYQWVIESSLWNAQGAAMWAFETTVGKAVCGDNQMNQSQNTLLVGLGKSIAWLRAHPDAGDSPLSALIQKATTLGTLFTSGGGRVGMGKAAFKAAQHSKNNSDPFGEISFVLPGVALLQYLGKQICRIDQRAKNRDEGVLYGSNGEITPECLKDREKEWGDPATYWRTLRTAQMWLNKDKQTSNIQGLKKFVANLLKTTNTKALVELYRENTPPELPAPQL